VTLPGGPTPAGAEGFNYGNGALATSLWPKGRLVAGRLPDGGYYAEIDPDDGSIHAKLGWWRGRQGRLRIDGRRLGRPARRLRASVPSGYGLSGFQPSGVVFPTTGCWRVRGRVGDASLTFVVRVTKRRAS
jgi:hypothetical protein